VETRDISFVGNESALSPTLKREDFTRWGVKPNAQPGWMDMDESATIDNISELLPGSQIHFQFDGMRLEVSVPQEYLRRDPQGSVSPEQWDDG
jgi:outer membrane usher protein